MSVATLDLIYDRVYSGQHMLILSTLAVLVAAYVSLNGASAIGDTGEDQVLA